MLSAKSLFQEIVDDDESFRLFCSIAAGGETQGGWENARIAALVPPSERALAPKITRHGADEDKHGRIFKALMKKRGLQPVEVPAETDYTMLLERGGIGLAHEKLKAEDPLSVRDVIVYLCHSRVTEQRAADQMVMLRKHFARHPEIGTVVRMISADEDNHLAYTHEELLRYAAAGHGRFIQRTLRECALAEIAVYRDVSLAVMDHMGRILGWPKAKAAVLAAGIHAVYAYERALGWRRMVSLEMPVRRDALGGPATAAPEFA
ncbi:ferritin-like domain-containing protein [Streptomyces scabiei]|uniref:ferritin-like domain-containing protein n=1 Tax=Streptomyces scabiei TaxID=1930 RepID=UPI001B32609C|nr:MULTISPECIES: ferritin-like domain-containing protein [Streptomyces]MBP5894728.1 ferritin-like domain-containing protein [Streptomyces sp. LBUM 1481]MBP5925000.1 ferritin-like domain-containing protein [Streptomyces sp. LBUM 1483]MDX2689259.1 ferritin-like domain-containing protein [Streptomyces scabiei]MDX2754400.1 ferritin-like domain-containing protein [Streptomyces scabiei]MDX2808601.1 ferritin-like domain-containing protein [Streptomyces scabiei]